MTNVINSETIGHHDTEADFSDINFDSSPLKSSSADMIVSTVTLDAAGHHFMATTTTNSINQLIQNAGNALVENPPNLIVQNNPGTNMNQLMTITREGGADQFHGLVSEGSVVQGFIQQEGQNAVVTQEHLISLKTEQNQEGMKKGVTFFAYFP